MYVRVHVRVCVLVYIIRQSGGVRLVPRQAVWSVRQRMCDVAAWGIAKVRTMRLEPPWADRRVVAVANRGVPIQQDDVVVVVCFNMCDAHLLL